MKNVIGGMFASTKEFLESGMDKVSKFFISDDVAKASMVLAAWITAADGKVDDRELEETEKFIQETDYLKDLDKDKLTKEYRKWTKQFVKEPDDALVYALTEITPLIHKPEAVNAVQLAFRIAKADDDASEKEMKVVNKACHFLGVSCSGEAECVLAD
jgi:tellurite resistance protein